MQKIYFFLVLLLACTGALTVRAQSAETPISGTITSDGGVPLAGATAFLKGTYTGTGTNEEGVFILKGNFSKGPVVLVVSFVGFETQEITLAAPDNALQIILKPSVMLDAVVVAASRVEENIGQVPVTVEKLDQRQIGQLTTTDVVAGLARFKGIDVSASSMLTTTFSTRAFNSSRSERVIQLADYMDTQLPSLSSNFGNLLGTPILDVGSIEVVHGPASALYGANAFNGVLLTNSRDAFSDPGLTVRLRGGNRSLLDGQIRYAVKIGDRVAFKLSGGAVRADDFLADNQSATNKLIEPSNNEAGSALGYDAVSRFGDAGAYTFPQATAAIPAPKFPGTPVPVPVELQGKTLFLPGFTETDLVAGDNKTHSYKVAPSVSVLLTDKLKATADYKYTEATTTYQSASRYRFVNSGAHQARLQLEGRNWFVRGFTTQDFSGQRGIGAYNLGILGGLMQQQPIAPGSAVSYGASYVGAYLPVLIGQLGMGQSVNAATNLAAAAADSKRLTPGTDAFNATRDRLVNEAGLSPSGQALGARVVLRSIMNEGSAQYNFKREFADIVVGGAYRQFLLGSDGTLFRDSKDGERIANNEFGAYAQISKTLLDDRLKLAVAGRVDNFKNFGTAFSPRASAVYSLGADKQHNFRASFSRAFRAPTQNDQYIKLDVGRAILLGNVDNGFLGYTTRVATAIRDNPAQLSPTNEPALQTTLNAFAYRADKLKLEEVNTIEIGYRAQLTKAFFVDFDYYHNNYNNFIATQNFIGNTDGSAPTAAQMRMEFLAPNPVTGPFRDGARSTRTIQVAANVDQQVQSQGAGLTLGYTVSPALTLLGNYSFNQLITTDFEEGTQSFFNTPKHKFNLGFDGRALEQKLSYNVNYRWADSYLYESTFATGELPVAQTVDAQLGYTIKAAHTTLQAGVSNLFDAANFQVYGAPSMGRLGYVGLLFDLK